MIHFEIIFAGIVWFRWMFLFTQIFDGSDTTFWLFDRMLLLLLLNCQLCLTLVTPWTVPRQAPLSMGFSRQEYWRGLPFPSPRDLPDPGIKLKYSTSPILTGRFFTIWTTRDSKTSSINLSNHCFNSNQCGGNLFLSDAYVSLPF